MAWFWFGGISMAEWETDISTATISSVSSKYAYTQSTITPEPVVKIKINWATTTLASWTDYNIEYSNNTNIWTAKIIITWIWNYTGSTEKSFTITNSISDMSVSWPSQTTFVVTWQPITPEITKVYLWDTILTQWTDYNVGYSDNTSIWTAKITITWIWNYTGHKEKTFTIISNDDVKYTINWQPKASNFTSSTITSNWTYKLYTDTTLTARLVPWILASNIILDLNWHTLTSTASDYWILLSRAWTATSHKTFSIIDSSENKWWKIVVNSAAKAAIQWQWNYNDITIWEWVTIEWWAITTLKENITLTVNWTINGWDDFAIATNGDSSKNITININEWAVLTSNVTAVYLPGKEWLVANIDWTIESKTVWIEIRAWELTIWEHANIKSTYEGTTSSTANWNWTTTVWSALAIAQHTTKLPIVVTINWWTFEWISAIYQSNPQNNSQEDAEKVSTTINTGTIIWKVTNTDSNHKLNINWWIFSTNPTEYISAWYKVFTTSDGKYEVANWYTITFNPNNEKDSYTKDVKANTTFSEPETPVYTWNIFLWWYNWDNKFDFSTAINSALTLEGKWEAISESTGTIEQDDWTSTGVILEPEEATISSSVQSSLNTSTTTTTVEWAVELNVYGDIDGDGTIDEWTDNIITKKVNFKKSSSYKNTR